MQRHPHEIAVRQLDALDAVHQLPHEEEAATVLALDIFWGGRVHGRRVEVEALALITDFDDELGGIDLGTDVSPSPSPRFPRGSR